MSIASNTAARSTLSTSVQELVEKSGRKPCIISAREPRWMTQRRKREAALEARLATES